MADPTPDLRCWARQDDAPPYELASVVWEMGWGFMCGRPPADDLGLCAHHRLTIIGRPVIVSPDPPQASKGPGRRWDAVTAPVCFVDCETTGLYPDRGHELYEIALIQADGAERRWWVKPDLQHADPAALRVSRYFERLPTKVDRPERVARDVARLTAGLHLVGACPWFDAAMVEAFLRKHGQAPAWHHRHRCVESLAMGRLGRDVGGLRDAAEALGIPVPEADQHTALGDTRVARAVWQIVMEGGES